MKDNNSLAHSTWNCKYHLVFAPKYRRMQIYGQIRKDIGVILRRLCEQKGIEIIEAELCPDHIHMLVSIPPKYSVSSIMGYLKGKSALMMFDRHANLKYKFGNRHFWSEGYYVSTVGLNEDTIKKYIQEQEKNDIMMDKLSVKEYEDPFRGQLVIRKLLQGQAKVAKAIEPERSEGQRLEAPAGNRGLQPQSKPPVRRVVLIVQLMFGAVLRLPSNDFIFKII